MTVSQVDCVESTAPGVDPTSRTVDLTAVESTPGCLRQVDCPPGCTPTQALTPTYRCRGYAGAFAGARRSPLPLAQLVGMMNPPTAPPISVVNRESALLLEPGVVHHSPAAPYSSHDALIPPGNGNRVSIFSTVVKRPGGALPGSWMRQDLTTLHKESVGVLRYPLQQQFGILSAAYHLGCKRTAFWALRSGHRMPGDGQAEFWVCSKRDLEAMKAVTELPAGAATMPAATRGVAAGESLLDATERRFDACWFSEQRKPLPMLPRDYD